MAALARVWLCTEESSLVLGDRITVLAIRSADDTPLERMPDGDVRITVRTEPGDGSYATVLTCPSDLAPGLLSDLARVLTEATDHPESCAFVFAERPADEPPTWTISSRPPKEWPG